MLRVLFVDDDPLFLEVLACRLVPYASRWSMTFAVGPEDALGHLLRQDFDVVVADVYMPEMDGPALLERVREGAPRTGRVILTSGSDDDTTTRSVAVAHQILAKPAPLPLLEAAVEAAYRLRASCADPGLRKAIGRIEHLPTPPTLYLDLCRELDAEVVDLVKVAQVISRDPGLVAHLLKVVNSAYFGLRKPVTDVNRAIVCVGTTLLRGLVVKVEVERMTLGLGPQVRAIAEATHRHAIEVAELAATLVPAHERGEAYTAGLLHDIGKLVLAMQDAHALLEVERDAHRLGATEHLVERMRFGSSHAEIGALLLELWAIPPSIRNAVLGHHEVPLAPERTVESVVALAEALVERRDRDAITWTEHELAGALASSETWSGLVRRALA